MIGLVKLKWLVAGFLLQNAPCKNLRTAEIKFLFSQMFRIFSIRSKFCIHWTRACCSKAYKYNYVVNLAFPLSKKVCKKSKDSKKYVLTFKKFLIDCC
jgi:hypothetical protein